jgi:hypothetical protein
MGRCGPETVSSEEEPVADSCEHGNESKGYIKVGDSLNYLSKYHLLKNDSTTQN